MKAASILVDDTRLDIEVGFQRTPVLINFLLNKVDSPIVFLLLQGFRESWVCGREIGSPWVPHRIGLEAIPQGYQTWQ